MSQRNVEASEEFVCNGECGDDMTWIVEGRFNAEGEFEPINIDDCGSDMDCPECGERGEPTDDLVRVVDLD